MPGVRITSWFAYWPLRDHSCELLRREGKATVPNAAIFDEPSSVRATPPATAAFAERHLDQFENLRFETSYGPVFVHMTRELESGWPSEAFRAMPGPMPGHDVS